jgi:hypothetical protein
VTAGTLLFSPGFEGGATFGCSGLLGFVGLLEGARVSASSALAPASLWLSPEFVSELHATSVRFRELVSAAMAA